MVIDATGKNAGSEILIDKEFSYLAKTSWNINAQGYANGWIEGKTRNLHSYILPPPKGMYVDHINGVRTDNRLSNLRIVTPSQNRMNSRNLRGVSAYKGVSFCRQTKRWACKVGHTWVGRFNSEVEAAIKYNEVATAMYGQYAKLNEVVK